MATARKRSIALLLVLVLAFGMIPTAFAEETEATDSTIPTEETLTEETAQPAEETDPQEAVIVTEETTVPTGNTELPVLFLEANSIEALADPEITGAPNAFANLTLPNGGIDIPAQGYMQHKKVLPLYSLYLRNQTGYANNYYVAYCIEPGVELANSGGHDGTAYTVNDMVDGSGALYRINRDQVEAIGIALLYGQKEIASKKDEQALRYEKLCRHAATQAIVWELACGWRSPYPPYTLWDTTLFDAITPSLYCASSVWGTNFYLDGMDDAYLDIQAKMQQHYAIPSFANGVKSSAPTYELTPDGNGKYSITLTDTNNILSQFTFTNTSQLTFSVNGNKLTITANGPISSTTVASGKSVPSLDQQVFFVWEKRELQKLMSCKTDMVYESLPAYFNVYAPNPTGSLSLSKSTEDNQNLAGWQFGIYSDAKCTSLISGPHTTDSKGNLSVSGLTAGTVYVKEEGHTDTTIAARYVCASTNPQKVTITSGATATVSFHNKLNTGSVKLMKETSCSEHLSGWQIALYTDAACTKSVSGSPFTTGEDGSVTVSDLSVGTLYAQEIPVDDPYWVCDSEVKTITIEAGKTATVTFHNTHYGNIHITKNAVNGSAEGWSFQILDADRNTIGMVKSDADGYAYSDILQPGQYFIREIHDREDTYWEYDAIVEKEVTVTAGSQAEVTYTNTQYGKIQVQKSISDGGRLDGWQFRITDNSGKEIEGSPFSTNASGLILTDKLQPGEYTVTELIPEDNLYYCTSENPQSITVHAGKTAEVSFANALHAGKIGIQKVDSRGEPLAGAKFLVEWSEDGSQWLPVVYSDTIQAGGCSTSNLEDGCLTSGSSGVLEWANLHPGLMYRLTELEAPEGYSLLSGPAFEGRLPAEELTVSLRVVNCEQFTLPQTGSTSALLFRISQVLCIVICTTLLMFGYRKERKQ